MAPKKTAADTPHDGHTIDVGVPTSIGPIPAAAMPLSTRDQFWLNRRSDGTWEVWGWHEGRETMLFSSGLDPDRALADRKSVV